MLEPYIDVTSTLIDAWRKGNKRMRQVLMAALTLVILAIAIAAISEALGRDQSVTAPIAGGLGVCGGLLAIGVVGYKRSLEQTARVERIAAVERRVTEDPQATKAAWELAQVKLESYLSRNLEQVRSIYILILIIMAVGFCLVGFGVFKVYESPANFRPSLLAAISGIIVNFIGATFLVIYRSTMNQAREYVTMLERINAVGMAMQILEGIADKDGTLREKAKIEIAKDLLGMYRLDGARRKPAGVKKA